MNEAFEDHCWRDVVPRDILDLYTHYARELYVGAAPALVAIDLYELAYQGGARPIAEIAATYPSSCGEYAWAAIKPTQRLFAAARAAGIPIFYSTGEVRPDSKPGALKVTNRQRTAMNEETLAIRPEFTPQPGDTVIRKQRASAFYGTPLAAHLTQLGVQSVIMLGESTSGCLRASAVDAYSNGYHVTLVEQSCFDRSPISHKINLFDLHHKYADVMSIDEVEAHLQRLALGKAS